MSPQRMPDLSFEPHDARALAQALTTMASGTRVRLAPGRFVLEQALIITSSIELIGEPGSTVLVGRGDHPIVAINKGKETFRVHGVTFENGGGVWGGAITCGVSATLLCEQCRFVGNRASEDGGAVFVRAARDCRIVRCTFERNAARRGGGGLDVGAGADVLVDRCIFQGNEAAVGAGVFLNGTGALELRNCTFVDNRAGVHPGGAGLFVQGAASSGPSAYVANTVFAGLDAIAGDSATKFDVFFAHCIVPLDLFAQRGFTSVKPNTSGEPQLVELAPGAWGLAPGSSGTCTADVSRIEPDAVDLLGRPLVRGGIADPGAIALSGTDGRR